MSKTNQQPMFDSIVQWQQSGMSKKAWCEQHNVVYSSFNYWHRRFQSRQEQRNRGTAGRFVQLMIGDKRSNAPWCELLFELPVTNSHSPSVALDSRQLQFILQGVSLQKVVYRPRLQKQPELSTYTTAHF